MISLMEFSQLIKALPARKQDSHKGDYGHVLVVGGDFGYAGAPLLAALGALHSGAGLVTLASQQINLLGINAVYPELITCAIDKPNAVKAALTKASVVVLGPGLGRSKWSQQVFKAVNSSALPLIIDADGLFFLAQQGRKNPNYIITPHPGEAARLLNLPQAIRPAQRLQALQELVINYKATTVLKGSGTLVAGPQHPVQICNAGNPAMATAGMGDLLSGIIAGLVAQDLNLDTAARLGVCVHALAGDAAAQHCNRGLIASDLLKYIPQIISSI